MGNLRLYGATSGYTELVPPAVAPDGVLSLPSGTGTIAKTTDQGLVHINTTTFSDQTSISMNDIFTSDHSVYQLVFDIETSSLVGNPLNMRFRTAGTDNTTTNYYGINVFGFYAGGSPSTQSGANGANIVTLGYTAAASNSAFLTLWVSRPQLASQTLWSSLNPASNAGQFGGGRFNATTQFDGFTLSGTSLLTGTIRVYGYKNS